MIDDFQDPMNDVLADNLVEVIATMKRTKRFICKNFY